MASATTVDVVMPQMGVSVSEGTISRWLKQEGDTVTRDETLLEISTDKVDTEVPCPVDGVLAKILAPEGETLPVGTKIAEISSGDVSGGAATEASAPAPSAVAQPADIEAGDRPVEPSPAPTASGNGKAPAPAPAPAPTPSAPSSGGIGRQFVSPVVARIAAEHGVDVGSISGNGSGGRVTKKDILTFIEGGGSSAPAPAAPAAIPLTQSPAPAAAPALSAPSAGFTGGEQVINFSPMRKAIARHMVESTATSAHVTSMIEVDMTRVVSLRNQMKAEVERAYGVKLTFTHFVARALIDAIAAWPWVNAEIRGDSAVIKSYVNLGVAVALDNGEGLIVPVVQGAEEKNLIGLARSINDLAGRARSKQLSPDDVQGGTFTLTNPGIYGAVMGTPIINQPQVAILDTEAIVKRPVVLTDTEGNDTIGIRSMMNLCISYDHRLVDGAYACQFLAHIKNNLQTWDAARFQG